MTITLTREQVRRVDELAIGRYGLAGLVLMEYLLRGLVRRVLILTPSSLLYQWQEEMAQKFNLHYVLSDSPEFVAAGPQAWTRFPRIVASIHMAKRTEHLKQVSSTRFDMVIVDEA
ncbi:MAG: ATP-dependent helicase, partial [Planctomycetota bacterium]